MSEPGVIDLLGVQPQQLQLPIDPERSSWEQERQELLSQLAAAKALERTRLDRIQDLEKALDQTLTSLAELKQKIRDQEFLENQLAHTEQFSHVQQQAIAKLKDKLTQQQVLEQRVQELTARETKLKELLALGELSMQESAAEARDFFPTSPMTAELARQQLVQVSLQQFCQELAAERDFYRNRVTEIETQLAELQEHVLQQEQRAREYETAIQHWKERSVASYRYALHLKELLEQIILERSPEKGAVDQADREQTSEKSLAPEANVLLPSLLMAFHTLSVLDTPTPPLIEPWQSTTEDVPAFLAHRRRNYRAS